MIVISNVSKKGVVVNLMIAVLISQLLAGSLGQTTYAQTTFGIDYRHLTTVNPGGSDTGTSISVAAGVSGVGTYVINPLTSISTLQGTPTTTSLSGYGWRTAQLAGINIPAGTWSFTVTTQTTVATGTANIMIFAYSTDVLGTDIQYIGSATGTSNVLGILSTQTETISFSAPATDLSNRILVVEYWLDVTTGPTLLAANVTFRIDSSTETVVVPTSPITTYYLATAQLHSMGIDESISISESILRNSIPLVSDNLFAVESISIGSSFPTFEFMALTDVISIMITKSIADAATISDFTSRGFLGTRSVSELFVGADIVGAGGILQFSVDEVFGFQDQTSAVKIEAETDDGEKSGESGTGSSGRRVHIVNPLKRLTINEPVLADDQGNPANALSIKIDQSVILISAIKNEQSIAQPFVFILQITDSEGYTQSIEIVRGLLEPYATKEVEVSLVPTNEGRFFGLIFCWSGLENGEPLSSAGSIDLIVANTN